jgi:membrane protease YdiL (CAAX protease family)
MDKRSFFSFKPGKETLVIVGFLALVTLANALANLFTGGVPYYLLYQGLFGLGACIFLPCYYVRVIQRESWESLGMTTKKWLPAVLVAVVFVALSVAGQLVKKTIVFPPLEKSLYICAGMIMSTLFEELFFRGFLQMRFEKAFGIIPSIILSGLAFSIYHIGYPKFQNLAMLLLMFNVGTFFAISFSITRNVLTSYLVNLPNAILTFLIRPGMIADINRQAAVVSLVTFGIAIVLLVYIQQRAGKIDLIRLSR